MAPNAYTASNFPRPIQALYTRVLDIMQEFEELGGTDDYVVDMEIIAQSAANGEEPGDRPGSNRFDDIRHLLAIGRDMMNKDDADLLQKAVAAEAERRIATFRANNLPVLRRGQRQTDEGDMVPALGFDHQGMFIVDPTVSECGRFGVDPIAYYNLTLEQVETLKAEMRKVEAV